MKNTFSFLLTLFVILIILSPTEAQQYKIRQSSSVMGMKTESTVYVKGMRKRTESTPMMGLTQPITIEQCDLQRTIKINDKKKLYFIDSFYKTQEEIIDEEEPVKTKPAAPLKDKHTKTNDKGGVITIYYSIRDTGERKKMYGLVARHIWTTQKMKPSPDACMMKDSILVKTDGWYIDLPRFNCPVRYTPPRIQNPSEKNQPECRDHFVTRRSGKGKLGFPLIETTAILMGGEQSKSMEFKTDLETLDFSMEKLDSMLFEIPPGYAETKNEEDLQDKIEVGGMINELMNTAKKQIKNNPVNDEKEPGKIRIGVLPPKADEQVIPNELQTKLVNALQSGKIETVPVVNEEEAKKLKCDYILTSELSKIKSGSKVGGLIKAIKNTDPNAFSTYSIEGNMLLTKLADGSPAGQQKIDGKFEGKVNDAAGKALENSGSKIISKLQ